jgi:hypothetical protein
MLYKSSDSDRLRRYGVAENPSSNWLGFGIARTTVLVGLSPSSDPVTLGGQVSPARGRTHDHLCEWPRTCRLRSIVQLRIPASPLPECTADLEQLCRRPRLLDKLSPFQEASCNTPAASSMASMMPDMLPPLLLERQAPVGCCTGARSCASSSCAGSVKTSSMRPNPCRMVL